MSLKDYKNIILLSENCLYTKYLFCVIWVAVWYDKSVSNIVQKDKHKNSSKFEWIFLETNDSNSYLQI